MIGRVYSVALCVALFCPDLLSAADPAPPAKSPRGVLSVKAERSDRAGDVALRVSLANTSQELLVNVWRHDIFDGLEFDLRDEKGHEVPTERFFNISTKLNFDGQFIIIKPGVSRSCEISVRSLVRPRDLPAGTYKVTARYVNEFQDETYHAKPIEVKVPPK